MYDPLLFAPLGMPRLVPALFHLPFPVERPFCPGSFARGNSLNHSEGTELRAMLSSLVGFHLGRFFREC